MRSKIFTDSQKRKPQFKENLDLLWSLPQKRKMQFIPYIPLIVHTLTTVDSDRCIEKINEKLKGNTEENLKIISLLCDIYEQWHPAKDTPANFIKDMEELNLFPKTKSDEAKTFMLEFLSIIEQNNLKRLKDYFISRGLPQLSGYDYAVDFRPLIRQPFMFLDTKKLNEYNPKIVDFTPVIICQFKTNEDEEISFQCSPEILSDLILNLSAALKEVDAAKIAFSEKKGIKKNS